MSKKQKVRKLRRPNISMKSTPLSLGETARNAAPWQPTTAEATSSVTFDYTHIKRDLKRIGLLAVSLITALVVLSFVLPLIVH